MLIIAFILFYSIYSSVEYSTYNRTLLGVCTCVCACLCMHMRVCIPLHRNIKLSQIYWVTKTYKSFTIISVSVIKERLLQCLVAGVGPVHARHVSVPQVAPLVTPVIQLGAPTLD